jgi:hypothetical protein
LVGKSCVPIGAIVDFQLDPARFQSGRYRGRETMPVRFAGANDVDDTSAPGKASHEIP